MNMPLVNEYFSLVTGKNMFYLIRIICDVLRDLVPFVQF